ncbi:MAG: hypothetical protein V1915_03945 [Candidatus Bathyarchaeota archaeon]
MSWFSKHFRRKKNEGEEPQNKRSDLEKKVARVLDFDEEEMTPEEEQNFIEKSARRAVDTGMEWPLTVILESSKPFTFLGEQMYYFVSPFLNMFNLEQRGNKYKNFFVKPGNIERLVERIEELKSGQK